MAALKQMMATGEPCDDGRRAPTIFDADRMRKAFEKVKSNAVQHESLGKPRPNYDLAYSRLERAAAVFDLLINRCQQLEAHVKDLTERTKAEAAQHDRVVFALKRHASEMQVRADEADKRVAAMKAQSAAAEAHAAACKAASEAAATEARTLSIELHEKLVAALALCSRVHVTSETAAYAAAEGSSLHDAEPSTDAVHRDRFQVGCA